MIWTPLFGQGDAVTIVCDNTRSWGIFNCESQQHGRTR